MDMDHKTLVLSAQAKKTTDGFIPYDQKQHHLNSNPSNKNAYYSPTELDKIRQMAHGPSEENLHLMLHRQNITLHASSVERVKLWGNTIMGYRKKRLAAQNEKARILEEERLKVDAEWAKLREMERQNAIQRARQLQQSDQPRVRALHSQLLLSNVLQERDKQKEYKKRRDMAQKIHDAADVLAMRLTLLDDIEKDKIKAQKEVVCRYEFADQIRKEINQKSEERKIARQMDCDYYSHVYKDIERETKEKSILEHAIKMQAEKDRCSALAEMTKEKKEAKLIEIKSADKLAMDNQNFNSKKNYHAIMKKEHEKLLAQQRDARFEKVSKIPMQLDREADEKRLAYILKSSHAKDNEDCVRQDAERAKHERHRKEQREFLDQHRRHVQDLKIKDKLIAQQDQKDLQERYEEYVHEMAKQSEAKNQAMQTLNASQAIQIESNRIAAAKIAKQNALIDSELIAARQTEDDEFDAYASKLVQEWRNAGKNVSPIEKSLEKERKGYSRLRRAVVKDY
ncbi:hypothetical protein BDV3_001138 [Batrachochytrium dendrobatidis]